MIRLDRVSKSFGGQTILDECSWAIRPNRTIGVVGPNGAGKTTLLRLIIEEEATDDGTVERASQIQIGYLPQDVIDVRGEQPVLDFVIGGRADLLKLESQLEKLDQEIAADPDDRKIALQADLRDTYEMEGGYGFRSTAREIAAGMGFTADDFERPLATFSGGWRMRALLAQLLLKSPDYLLLDEPTNHLDAESLTWLERFLRMFEGTALLVSHDRYFLNSVVNEIAELEFGKIRSFHTNYDGYREQKVLDRERLESMKVSQDKEIAQIERFIERFRAKNTKATAVQSRVKKLAKMERVDVGRQEAGPIRFRFPQPKRTPKVIAKFEHVTKTYGDVEVYRDLNFSLFRGDKIALVGPNGGGKTTLLKILRGIETATSGELEIADVKIAYFAQHAADALDENQTAEESVNEIADVDEGGKVRHVLGAFGFSGDEVKKPIGVLSGGEKNRVALARLMFEKASVLLLDEPTNHLDIQSRQVLEFAINDFDGAVIVVSHDRYFVNEVAQRVVYIGDGVADEFVGSYDDFLKSSQNESAPGDGEKSEHSKKEQRRAAAEQRKMLHALTKDLKAEHSALEKEVADLETQIEADEQTMADPSLYENPERMVEVTKGYEAKKVRLEVAVERWMELEEEIERIEQEAVE